jgi:apolipoprotein N-acyltransferase
MQRKSNFLLLSLLSAILLGISWYWHLTIFIFFGFVPLLFIEDGLNATVSTPRRRLKLLGFTYLAFLLWNLIVTWWVVYASVGGALMAFICNSALMTAVFIIFSRIKHRIAKPWAIWLLIPIWIAWEHIHTLWDITWPWLTLGNVFAFKHNWVQWYEFTGTSGGSLWILTTNILIFNIIKHNTSLKFVSAKILKIASIIILPILISYLIAITRNNLDETNKPVSVVVVQPNIDPYSEKFYVGYEEQFHKLLRLVKGKIDPNTEYLVLPETFITGLGEDLNEERLNTYLEIQWFRDSLITKFPNLKIITGANTYVFYHNKEDITATARKSKDDRYYDVFNTGIMIDRFHVVVYHKSKLVPGVERMPFPALLRPLERFAINMGGTMGSLGVQDTRTCFKDTITNMGVAPVICYESVYADYVTEYIRTGANFIFIITNDGWWDDTPGYIQHLNYARLRAIENRRQIARSANTGISCFIDEFGNIYEVTEWWKEAVIKKDLYKNNELTFFSRFGDLISYTSVFASILLILWSLFLRLKSRKAG